MTIYDPVEVVLSGDTGIEHGPGMIRTEGNSTFRGYRISGSGGYDDLGGSHKITVDLSWDPGDESVMPIPALFVNGDPNVSYLVTIQAVDASEEE